MRGGGRQLILLRALLSSPWRLLVAGCLMGIGTFCMQYLIVGAMKVHQIMKVLYIWVYDQYIDSVIPQTILTCNAHLRN